MRSVETLRLVNVAGVLVASHYLFIFWNYSLDRAVWVVVEFAVLYAAAVVNSFGVLTVVVEEIPFAVVFYD